PTHSMNRLLMRIMNTTNARRSAAALVVAALAAQPTAAAEMALSADAGFFHDSNLSRAQYAADVRPDAGAAMLLDGGTFFAPTAGDTLTIAAFTHGELYRRYRGLDNVALGARAYARHKFGLGHEAPWIALSLAASHDDYDDSLRDSNRLRIEMELGQRYGASF